VIIWLMCISCWVPKATNTHSVYVKLIPFVLQPWLLERASMLRYTYIACLVEKSRNDLKIIGSRGMTRMNLRTEEPQILGATIQNLVVWGTWCPGFVHSWFSTLARGPPGFICNPRPHLQSVHVLYKTNKQK
jgi:hypothetical protein